MEGFLPRSARVSTSPYEHRLGSAVTHSYRNPTGSGNYRQHELNVAMEAALAGPGGTGAVNRKGGLQTLSENVGRRRLN
jgi:hypothetical protein